MNPQVGQEKAEMNPQVGQEKAVVAPPRPWDPVMLSIVVDKDTGNMSFSQQGLRGPEDVRKLIYGIHRALELATDLLLQITNQSAQVAKQPEPQEDEQEA